MARGTRRYQRFIEAVSAPAVVVTPDGVILSPNARFATLVQVPADKLITQSLHDFMAPEDWAAFLHLVADCRETGSVGELTLRAGNDGPIAVQLALTRWGAPGRETVVVVATDLGSLQQRLRNGFRRETDALGEQVRAQSAELATASESLRTTLQALRLLQTVFEQAADGIVVRDPEGRLLFANAAAKRHAKGLCEGTTLDQALEIWGITRDAAGTPLPVDEWPIAKALRGEQARGVEWHRVGPDGRPYVVINSAAPLRDPNGIQLGAVAITTDITDRTRAEEALAAQRRLLQAILEQAGDSIIVRDAEGRVSFVNAAARRHARMPPEGTPLDMAAAVWGETVDGMGNPLPVERWPVASALRGEPGQAMELHRVGPDGRPLVVLSRATPVRNERGELLGAVVTGTDITTLKDAEQALRQRVADKELLLREVHHRTKNNLAMLADVVFLQSEAVRGLEAKEALSEAYGRVVAMARLHDQLYQSMESGRIRLVEYLRKLVEGVEELWPAGRFRLEASAEEVHLDPDRAIHAGLVVNELLTNAVKHAFPDGKSGEIGVRLRSLADQLELEVWDTGKGLPAGLDLEHAKTLGLRMVHMLARRLDARVEIQRAGGTSVKLDLPLEAPGSAMDSSVSSRLERTRRHKGTSTAGRHTDAGM